MTIETGKRLGPYEVVALLGAGGMGEVYRARDTRLERDVAVKVLPAELAQDPRFEQRFEREAKTISQLQHPNVCTLFDVGTDDGLRFLVMELLEGESLAQRLGTGPMSVDEAQSIGTDIAEGLEAAHRRGIVHRDLKPGNVMLTPSGAKILDFGLARPRAAEDDDPLSASGSATLVAPLTEEGHLVGTMPYMAPEQLSGRAADTRTDIWALGCVLYEMLSGSRPFDGDSEAALITSIMSGSPEPPSRSGTLVPTRVDHVISRCLERDPERRWQSARDVGIELAAALDPSSVADAAAHSKPRPSPWLWLGAAALVLMAGFGLGRVTTTSERVAESQSTTYFPISAPPGTELRYRVGPMLNISPDGTQLALTANSIEGNSSALFLYDLTHPSPPRVLERANIWIPFFSPTSEAIAFKNGLQLLVQSLSGGTARGITGLVDTGGGWWRDDGTYLINEHLLSGIETVSGDGSLREIITTPEGSEGHRHPQPLPGGRHALVTVTSELRQPRIEAISLSDGASKLILDRGFYARYLPTGHLVFAETDTLMAVAFDLEALEIRGEPVAVVNNLVTNQRWGHAEYAVSDTGTLAYYTGSSERRRNIVRVRPNQPPEILNERPLPLDIENIKLSPDGSKLALSTSARDELWIFDVERGELDELAGETDPLDYSPAWSSDGSKLSWLSANEQGLVAVTRTLESLRLVTNPLGIDHGLSVLGGWTTEDHLLVASDFTLATVDLASGTLKELPGVRGTFPALSPDGKWIAYTTLGGRGFEVRIATFPDTDHIDKIVTLGYGNRWSADGRKLFLGLTNHVYTVRFDPETGSFSQPEMFLEHATDDRSSWDVTPEGDAIIAIERRPSAQLIVVQNWFDELLRKVPIPD